jgi:hypothetical protein
MKMIKLNKHIIKINFIKIIEIIEIVKVVKIVKNVQILLQNSQEIIPKPRDNRAGKVSKVKPYSTETYYKQILEKDLESAKNRLSQS